MAARLQSVTGAATSIIAVSTTRAWWFIQNNSASPICVAWEGTTTTLTNSAGAFPGMKIAASGGQLSSSDVDTKNYRAGNAVWAISDDGATVDVTVHEMF